MKKLAIALTVILVLALAVSSYAVPSYFGSNFSSWLSSHGYSFPKGGFGGKSTAPNASKPVIVFVHGNGSKAQGSLADSNGWKKTYDYLKARGWTDGELYAVNYGIAGLTGLTLNTHSSTNINTVKNFIKAVAAYTGKQVTVIAHSLGCTLSRKAMVDGNLYSKVKTFISIAGANHGLAACGYFYWGLYFCLTTPSCSYSNGLCRHPYSSYEFVDKLNRADNEMKYKTTRTYVIISTTDEVCIPYYSAYLDGAYKSYTTAMIGHLWSKDKTPDIQYKMIMWTY